MTTHLSQQVKCIHVRVDEALMHDTHVTTRSIVTYVVQVACSIVSFPV